MEYDKLFDDLVRLEAETGIVLSNSPTQTVGYEVKSKLAKVQHSIPLLGLDKTKNVDDLIKFRKGKDLVAMAKLDGLAVELIYEDGRLVQASTRGDGHIGEDITHNARVFKGLPLSIPHKGYLKVLGEAIIHFNYFEKINGELPEESKYKTPRNLVSGSVRQLDNRECRNRHVWFYAYSIIECPELSDISTKALEFVTLAEFGFTFVPFLGVSAKSTEPMICEFIEMLKYTAKEKNLPIDGLVFTFNDKTYGASLGTTSHHPLHSIAFKFEDEVAITALRGIEWSMGRTGQLTPVAIFDTVELDGTDVSRASLHNISIIEGLQLGIGDEIQVIKANMIIPQIIENNTRSNSLELPKVCPVCRGETAVLQTKEARSLVCASDSCSGKILSKFVHFVGKSAMNIDGLSEATLEKFLQKGWLKTFADIYSLNKYETEIVHMEGFGKRSYDKLWAAIESSRNTKLENFLVALGIPNIGRTASKAISKLFNGDWERFEYAVDTKYDFTQLDDFGNVANQSIHNYFANDANYQWYAPVASVLNFEKQSVAEDILDNPFLGKTVVATGSFENFTRTSIQEKLESLGAKVSGSVSKNTDFVIAGEKAGSKLSKAQQLGVKTLSESEFMEMVDLKWTI